MSARASASVTLVALLASTACVAQASSPATSVASAAIAATSFPPGAIALELHVPDGAHPERWPITTGVPFARGALRDERALFVLDDLGRRAPADVVKTADWEDGSVRWVRVDFLAEVARRYAVVPGSASATQVANADDLRVAREGGDISVTAGRAKYVFVPGGGSFDALLLDAAPIVRRGRDAFHLVDARGVKSTLRASKTTLAIEGRRHVVVRVEGEYRAAPQGEVVARAVVDFHFFAGLEAARVTHELVLTHDLGDAWIEDSSLDLPLALGGGAVYARANDAGGDLGRSFRRELAPGRALVMVQDTLPHFGQTESRFQLLEVTDREAKELSRGPVAGDWLDVSTSARGLAAQVPAFAEQFPKALRGSAETLSIGLWAREGGMPLDLRTGPIIARYFGHDWIPPEHECNTIESTAAGVAKTHDVWLYPHAGALADGDGRRFAGTRDEVYASVDPAHVARSGALGPLVHERDVARFPEAEAVVSDYFDRTVLAGSRVFPATGYLYWGMYPYGAQPWEQKNGRWYPTVHRLARGLDYQLKRTVWVLFGRSGERKYHDYARRYTRLLRDLSFSHDEVPGKPKGWIVEGAWHCPIIWGQLGPGALARGRKGERPAPFSETTALAFASSEDVIQMVYDWLFTGDLQSRDMVKTYIEALLAEVDRLGPEKVLAAGAPRSEALLRMIGSAYELEHDVRLRELGRRISALLLDEDGTPSRAFPAQWGKWGEVFSAYWYYWSATGDDRAERALLRAGDFVLDHGGTDLFFDRSSPLFQIAALAAKKHGRADRLPWIARAMERLPLRYPTLAATKTRLDALSPTTTEGWGQDTMIAHSVLAIGVPAAELVLSEQATTPARAPFAEKIEPTAKTHLVFEHRAGKSETIALFVNVWGDRTWRPELLDARGKKVALDIVSEDRARIDRAAPIALDGEVGAIDPTRDQPRSPDLSPWYGRFEDQRVLHLRVPAALASGAYELDLGDRVSFTVLATDLEKLEQVAPDGVVLAPGERVFFDVPPGVEALHLTTSLPIELTDPSGHVVVAAPKREDDPATKDRSKQGALRLPDAPNPALTLPTKGRAGAWSMIRKERIPTFVRLEDRPLVIAHADPSRLFPIDLARFPRTSREPPPRGDHGFERGRFGDALYAHHHWLELPGDALPTTMPRTQGTVELWVKPTWSTTDHDFEHAMMRVQLYRADPITLSYYVDPDPNHSKTYDSAVFLLQLRGAGEVSAKEYLHADRWVHVACTWTIDGANGHATIFIDGRRRSDFHFDPKLAPKAPPEKLAWPPKVLRVGSAHLGRGSKSGELLDELRVSDVVRYTKDFDPPKAAFTPDAHTIVLGHFDGTTTLTIAGKPNEPKLVRGDRIDL